MFASGQLGCHMFAMRSGEPGKTAKKVRGSGGEPARQLASTERLPVPRSPEEGVPTAGSSRRRLPNASVPMLEKATPADAPLRALPRALPHREPAGSRIVPAPHAVAAVTGGVTLLIDMEGGQRLTLTEFGGRLWGALADHPTLPALIERLRDDESRSEQLAEDVVRALAEWRARGLLRWQ